MKNRKRDWHGRFISQGIVAKKYIIVCPLCKKRRQKKYKDWWAIKNGKWGERCLKCSRFKKGQTNAGGFKKGKVPWNIGKGKASYWQRIKCSKEWKEMRKKVFERDNYTCQKCGNRGGELHPDHIKPKSAFPKLVFKLSNIRTLCRECHKKTDTYGYGARLIKMKHNKHKARQRKLKKRREKLLKDNKKK